ESYEYVMGGVEGGVALILTVIFVESLGIFRVRKYDEDFTIDVDCKHDWSRGEDVIRSEWV
ncbi:hypothetical protein, partial [Bacillus altitudinis]|uniref:hypothetical protein n=1 Tax=Bacillus altitudinis TaxID=293387 RepID=UPI001C92CA56